MTEPLVSRKLPLLLAIVLSSAVIIGAVAIQQPLLAIGGVAFVLMAATALIWPDGVTLFVLFVIYTNAAVVAVRFHGLPFIVGAALPGLLIFPLGRLLVLRREELIVDKVVVLMVFMVAVYLLGTLFAVDKSLALENLVNFATEGLLLYLLILNTIRTKKMLQLATWAVLIAGLLLGGLTFYQQVTKTYDRNYGGFAQTSEAAFGTGEQNILGEIEQPRLGGPLGEQNRYAQIMVMLVPLGMFQFWGSRSKALRLLAILATALCLIGVLLTFSRGAAVGFALMLIVMAMMRYIKLHQLLLVLVGVFLLLQGFPQFGARLDSLTVLSELLTNEETSISSADSSTRSRVTEMLAAVLMFADHPVVGVGPGMYPQHYQEYATRVGIRVLDTMRRSHNLFLGLAAEAGVLGLLAFGAILFLTLRDLARHRRLLFERFSELAYGATGLFLSITVFLTTSLFLHFAYIRYFWLMMGLAGATNHIAQRMLDADAATKNQLAITLATGEAGLADLPARR